VLTIWRWKAKGAVPGFLELIPGSIPFSILGMLTLGTASAKDIENENSS
jgi:hypothetical protein